MNIALYRIIERFKKREYKARSFFIVFYLIGFIGLVLPFSRDFFIKITPYALILNFTAVLIFHRGKINSRILLIFSGIYLAGFFIELIGVNKGFIFGEYYYGKGLGLKISDTPLLIGINWLLLTYLSANITERLNLGSVPAVLVASVIMVFYDLLLEQVAPCLDMWYWRFDKIPLQNSLAWFIISLLFHSVIKVFRISTKNETAPVIFFCQVGFFLILLIFLK